ncbi:MAG: ATP-binding cassette domain-containing protein [Candidatus Krumholzibacteria bacterium]|nr:ATP-binding cassette domain-containing protein [Candidatus Krumholzibacteria bacterium]
MLSLENVTKRFNGHTAVDRLSLVIEPGVVYGLVGPNGAGKTTTIRMTMGIIEPDEGTIRLFDEPFSERVKERIGYLPEERGLYRKMKVLEHLVFLGQIKGLSSKTAAERGLRWLDRVELGEWKDKPVEALSKGMQQKVQFISTILHDPRLVILDEPFSGLDPINTQMLKDVIMQMKDRGCTVILSTHLMDQVEKLCEKICLIDRGRSVLEGDLGDIKRRFGQNVVSLRIPGGRAVFEAYPGVERIGEYGRDLSLTLRGGVAPEQILRHALDRGPVERFEVGQMSLHDIFIAQVRREGGGADA